MSSKFYIDMHEKCKCVDCNKTEEVVNSSINSNSNRIK